MFTLVEHQYYGLHVFVIGYFKRDVKNINYIQLILSLTARGRSSLATPVALTNHFCKRTSHFT